MTEFSEWRDAPKADFAVIGDPIHHSLSPSMHMAAYSALALPYRYVAVHVVPGEVGEALEHLRSLGYQGVNVTVPHKAEAMKWAIGTEDRLSGLIGAANTFNLERRTCINTDGPGFLETLGEFVFQDRTALILGAGGSAQAVGSAMSEAGWRLRIFNRTESRAREMAAGLKADVVREPDLRGVELVVNTTSAALKGESLPIDWARASHELVAYDLMYGKEPTPFLAGAASRGLRTIDGLDLLVAQGALAFEWWLGVPAPRSVMREALR